MIAPVKREDSGSDCEERRRGGGRERWADEALWSFGAFFLSVPKKELEFQQ